jgi:hypothetical protein
MTWLNHFSGASQSFISSFLKYLFSIYLFILRIKKAVLNLLLWGPQIWTFEVSKRGYVSENTDRMNKGHSLNNSSGQI